MRIINNPYAESKVLGHRIRVQSFIEEEDYKIVRRTADGESVLSAVIATMWQKLVAKLKQHGITDYTQHDAFVEFINNFDFVYIGKDLNILRDSVNGGTIDRAVAEADASDDSGGTKGVCSASTGATNVVGGAECGNPPVKTGKGRTKGSKAT